VASILFNVTSYVVSTLIVDGENERGLFPSGGVAADGPIPLVRFGLAHRAFQWQPLFVEKLSFRLAELPPPGAEFAPRPGCVELGSSMALACSAAALLPPQRSGLLEGNG